VLLALMAYGDRHRADGPPVVVRHEGCGEPVTLVAECAAGHRLGPDDRMRSTPGAARGTQRSGAAAVDAAPPPA
jgi:hypothetical protein